LKCLSNSSSNPVLDLTTSAGNNALQQVNAVTVPCCGDYYTIQNISLLNVSTFIFTTHSV
jgi:hypothetical protein